MVHINKHKIRPNSHQSPNLPPYEYKTNTTCILSMHDECIICITKCSSHQILNVKWVLEYCTGEIRFGQDMELAFHWRPTSQFVKAFNKASEAVQTNTCNIHRHNTNGEQVTIHQINSASCRTKRIKKTEQTEVQTHKDLITSSSTWWSDCPPSTQNLCYQIEAAGFATLHTCDNSIHFRKTIHQTRESYYVRITTGSNIEADSVFSVCKAAINI